MITLARFHRYSLFAALAIAPLVASNAEAGDHRNCNELLKVKRYHECMDVYQNCMRSHKDYEARMRCVDDFIDKIVPPSVCKGDDFYQQCLKVKEIRTDCQMLGRAKPNRAPRNGEQGAFPSVKSIEEFVDRVKAFEVAVPAIGVIREKYGECLGRAAYQKHNTRCGGSTQLETLDQCMVARDRLALRWQDFAKTLAAEVIAPALKRAGHSGTTTIEKAEMLLDAAQSALSEPRLAVADLDIAGLKKQLRETFDRTVAEAATKRDAAAQAEAEATARRLPKSKMKNAKLAKKIRAVIEGEWRKDEFKRAILSGKKWVTNYVYIGRYRTNRVSNRSLPLHVITRPAKAKHCRLYDISVVQDRVNKSWEAVRFGGVGDSKWTLCPSG